MTEYAYDAYTQLTQVYYGGQAAPVKTVTFTYDNAGNMLTWNDGTHSASYTYDDLNRVVSMTTTYPFGSKTISYTYDRLGNRQTATYPDGPAPLNYSYDDLNRLTAINYGASAVTYSYDNAGRPTTKILPNGITTEYLYDNANRLTSLTNRRSDNTLISLFTYTHDNTGNRLTMTETTGTHNYNYDNIYRLTGAAHPATSTEIYTYDRVGNRLTDAANPDWTYDANNRLQSYDGITYTHDNNGNTTSKDEGATLTTYSYDQENRLTTATPNSLVVTYTYDPFGKRLSKTVGGATTYYLYDEEDIIGEYDTTGALIATYIHGQGIDEPISMTRGGNTYFYTMDGLGSVKDLTDSTQTLVEQYQYDSFGNLTNPPTTGNPYTYTSREYDSETGLLFYRARYYDPKGGRFLQQDPKGFSGGDVNFYTYVANNSINSFDPFGLERIFPPGFPYPDWFPKEPESPLTNPGSEAGKNSWQSCLNAPGLSDTSPECDKYGEEKYLGTGLRCFCKCAGNSPWSRRVRGCLRCMYDKGYSNQFAHEKCYKAASDDGLDRPELTLAKCYCQCLME